MRRITIDCGIDLAMSEGTNGPVDTMTFTSTTLKNAQKGKITFENHYENLLIQHRDRTNRFVLKTWG